MGYIYGEDVVPNSFQSRFFGHNSSMNSDGNFTILNSIGQDGLQYDHKMDNFNRILRDNEGNSIIYGIALSMNDNEFNNDFFLMKQTEDGEVIWSKRFGGSSNEYLGSHPILVDSNDNLIVIGETSSVDLELFSPIYSEPSFNLDGRSTFVLKLNRNGEVLISSYLSNQIKGGIISQNNNLWLIEYDGEETFASYYSEELDLLYTYQIYSGNFVMPYHHSFYNQYGEITGDVILMDQNNNLYLMGYLDPVTLILHDVSIREPQLTGDIAIYKIDQNGIVFSSLFENIEGLRPDSIFLDSSNDLILSMDNSRIVHSHEAPSTIFDPSHNYYRYTYKLDTNGNIAWNNSITVRSGYHNIIAISTLTKQDQFVVMLIRSNIFDENSNLVELGNITYYSFDSNGLLFWELSELNQPSWKWRSDFSLQITSDSNGNVYASSAYFAYPYDDNMDFVIHKISTIGELLWKFEIQRAEDTVPDPIFKLTSIGQIYIVSHTKDPSTLWNVNIIQLDSERNILFNQTYGGSGKDAVFDFIICSDNQISLTGVTFSPDLILKNEFEGEFQNLAGTYSEPGFTLTLDSNGNIIQSSYLISDPNSLISSSDSTNSPYLIGIAISSFLLSFIFGYKFKIAVSPNSIDSWETPEIISIVSNIFRDSSVSTLILGISKDDDLGKGMEVTLPENIAKFKYMFHPVRLSILKLLHDNLSLSTINLRDLLNLSWNLLNPHISSLEEKNLIIVESDFVEGKLMKIVKITVQGIGLFNDFRTLMIEFLDQPGKDVRISELNKVSKEKKDQLYPNNYEE